MRRGRTIELIERETFRRELLSLTYYGDGDYYSGREAERDSIIDRLNEQPAIDAAPVRRGRWVNELSKIPKCSVCGEYSDDADRGAMICPWCGARMDGGDEHEAG